MQPECSLVCCSKVFLRRLHRRLSRSGSFGWGVADANSYRPHDFRRGHARDLLRGGRRLHEILRAGEWSSPRFLEYLDRCELEDAAVLEAHLDEESDEN